MNFIKHNPNKLKYELIFHDVTLDYPQIPVNISQTMFDTIFEYTIEHILNNKYLVILVSLRNHRMSFINDLVTEAYDLIMQDNFATVCDLGYYESDLQSMECDSADWETLFNCKRTIELLEYNEDSVKRDLFQMTYIIFCTIFHELYNFINCAINSGIKYVFYTYSHIPNQRIIKIDCHVDYEVIKKYDESWYDRLSLLYSV